MLNKIALAVAAVTLAGCAQAPQENLALMLANATPPTDAMKSQMLGEARELLFYPDSVRNAEISYVGTQAEGSQWVCVRAEVGDAMAGYVRRNSIAVMTPSGILIGTQTNCPTCREPSLRWLPFPELEDEASLSG